MKQLPNMQAALLGLCEYGPDEAENKPQLQEVSSYASALAFNVVTAHPDCIKDDVPLDSLIAEIAAAIDRGRTLEKGPGFSRALDMAKAGYADWAGKEHNAKWVRRIDGTPIPNDLLVCIAEAVADGRT